MSALPRERRHEHWIEARIKQLEDELRTEPDKRRRDLITREYLDLTDPSYLEASFL